MKKQLSLLNRYLAVSLTLLLLSTLSLNAQTAWTMAEPSSGTGLGVDKANQLCTDASGNVYIIGNYGSTGSPTVDFDLGAGTQNRTTNGSVQSDGFIASYDKTGAFRWVVTIGSAAATAENGQPAGGICTDGTNVWACGSYNAFGTSPQIMSTTTVSLPANGTANNIDSWVAKFSCSTGAVQWSAGYGGSGVNTSDVPLSITTDGSGNCYVLGNYAAGFTLNSVTLPATAGGTDALVMQFNSAGAAQWALTGGSSGNDMGAGSITYCSTSPASLFIGGTYNNGSPVYGSYTLANNATTFNDMLIARCPATGGSWSYAVGFGVSGSVTDNINAVCYDSYSGSVFVSGGANNNGGSGSGSSLVVPGYGTLTCFNFTDNFFAKYNLSTNLFTYATVGYGTPASDNGGADAGYGLCSDGQGGIFQAGEFGSAPIKFSSTISATNSGGGTDIFVTKYSATTCAPIWALSAGGSGTDQGRGIGNYLVSSPYSSSLYVTGAMSTTTATFGSTTLTPLSAADFYLAKINDADVPLSATQSQNNLTCNGVCTGSATIVASGGTAPYTYAWSPSGGSGATASSLCAANYTCTITDNASNQITKTFTITQPSAIVVTPVSQTNISCNGGTNGAASVSASGGTGTLTYNWTPGNPTGDGTASVTGLTAGNWTCTVTDANSCTSAKTFTVTQPSALSATTAQTNVACNGGSNGVASVSASGGTTSYSYAWSPSGGTGATATGLSSGNYTCTITDANSCSITKTFTVTQPTALSATTAQTNVACNGGSNGVASVSASGGTTSYSYAWSPSGGAGATATGLSSGNYTCTITDANSCSIAKTFTVTQPTALSATTTQTNVACNSGSNGVASVSASGGTTAYTYAWSPSGGTGATASGLAFGNYTCTITDANSCSITKTFTVTQPTALSATTTQTNVACNGGTNGVASVNASGGTTAYTYAWSPSGGTGATASGLASGNYTCTITDANSCSITKTFTVTQPTALSATTTQTNVACNGGSTGAASVSASGGTTAYSYSWSPSGGTSATANLIASGNYTCTITDANSCSIVKTFTITQPPMLTATTTQTNVACNGGSTGAASVSGSGGSPVYHWSWLPSGGTGATASNLTAGTYTCTITDANFCSIAKAFTIIQPAALSATTTQTNVACNGGSNGAVSVSASGGTTAYTYAWSPSGGTAATASGLSQGNYTCTITDANSCSITKTFAVTQPTALSATTTQTNVACFGNASGVASVNVSGGTTSYSYAWSPSGGTAATASSLASGGYTCTITDANSCSIVKTFSITQPSSGISATTTQTNVACNGGSNAIAAVNASGGTGSFSYAWSPSGGSAATASGLTAGNYTCTISDASTCSSIKTFTITQPTVLSATTTQTNVACNSGSNAIASVNVSGGTTSYSYAWSPSGGTGATASGLVSANYTCTITDANSCSITKTFTVTQPTTLSATTTQTNVACNGGSNGVVSVSASGGTTAYTYAWSPSGGTGATASGLSQGNYTCTITDANSCSITKTFIVTQPTALFVTTTQTNVACNGGSNAIASVNVSGGTPTYTYSWSPSGGTSATANGLIAGGYTCSITDSHGCTATSTVVINQPAVLMASSTSGNISCNGGATTVTVSATGGTTVYTGTGTFTATAGSYTYTVTDANSCSATTTITITEPTLLTATATSGTIACNGGATTVTVSATGGTPTYIGLGTFTTTAGSYTYNVTDANGCSTGASVLITEPSLLQVNVSTGTISCNGMATTAIVSASGGTPAYTGQGTFTVTAGSYTYTVNDANSCSTSTVVTINQPAAIVSSQSPTVCAGGSITVGPHTYSTIGTYTDVLTAVNGCDSTVTTNLTVNNAIDISVTVTGPTITANATGATYQWIDCNNGNAPISGATNQSYTASNNGNYAVIITEGLCSATSTCTAVIGTDIAKNNAVNKNLLVYPNPFTNEFNITSAVKTTAVLFDMLGNKITEFALQNQTQTIHIGELAPGIYYLQVDTQKIKIIKQ